MKNTITILLLLISLNSFGQKNKERDFNTGIPITIGGVALTLGSAFTPTEFERTQGTYGWQESPIWKQDARFIGIIAGTSITATGLITTLAQGRKKQKRW